MRRFLLSLLFLPVILNAQDIVWPNSPGVHLLEGIEMKELGRKRNVWIYLPPGYVQDGFQAYPVIYAQDGQNLFEDSSSFTGEWRIDEQLDALYEKDRVVPIVVAIENGGAKRIDEYSPWPGKYGGGEGDAYARFLAEELVPMIEKNYMTQPDRDQRFLLGSSLGALINSYIQLKYPDLFSANLAFSPAYWYNPQIMQQIDSVEAGANYIFTYHIAGETEDSGGVALRIEEFEDRMESALGESYSGVHLIHENGRHNEAYWSEQFSAAWRISWSHIYARSISTPVQNGSERFICQDENGAFRGRTINGLRSVVTCEEIAKLNH